MLLYAILHPYYTIYREMIGVLLDLKHYLVIYGSTIAIMQAFFNNKQILLISR